MSLQEKILNPSIPVTFFEMVPPPAGKPQALADLMSLARHIAEASGGILGIHWISAVESEALETLAKRLKGRPSSAELLKQL